MTNNNTPIAFWNRTQKRRGSTAYKLKLPSKISKLLSIRFLCGLLVGVAGTALATWFFLSVTESTATVFSPSAVCDVVPLDKPTPADTGHYTMRIVVYGDLDSDDDVPCGMLSDVYIAIIHEKWGENALRRWWEAVGGDESGIEYLPPGARVPFTKTLSDTPARFITTDTGGIAEITIPYDPDDNDYSLCIISPTNDVIVGCSHNLSLRSRQDNMTAYVYLTYGHAVIERDSSNRYQRFLDSPELTWSPATVTVTATSSDDFESHPYDNLVVAIVRDAHVNAWWATWQVGSYSSQDNGLVPLYDSYEVLTRDWVHLITTGTDGSGETVLSPGNYLICTSPYDIFEACTYESFIGGRNYKFTTDYWGGRLLNIRQE